MCWFLCECHTLPLFRPPSKGTVSFSWGWKFSIALHLLFPSWMRISSHQSGLWESPLLSDTSVSLAWLLPWGSSIQWSAWHPPECLRGTKNFIGLKVNAWFCTSPNLFHYPLLMWSNQTSGVTLKSSFPLTLTSNLLSSPFSSAPAPSPWPQPQSESQHLEYTCNNLLFLWLLLLPQLIHSPPSNQRNLYRINPKVGTAMQKHSSGLPRPRITMCEAFYWFSIFARWSSQWTFSATLPDTSTLSHVLRLCSALLWFSVVVSTSKHIYLTYLSHVLSLPS